MGNWRSLLFYLFSAILGFGGSSEALAQTPALSPIAESPLGSELWKDITLRYCRDKREYRPTALEFPDFPWHENKKDKPELLDFSQTPLGSGLRGTWTGLNERYGIDVQGLELYPRQSFFWGRFKDGVDPFWGNKEDYDCVELQLRENPLSDHSFGTCNLDFWNRRPLGAVMSGSALNPFFARDEKTDSNWEIWGRRPGQEEMKPLSAWDDSTRALVADVWQMDWQLRQQPQRQDLPRGDLADLIALSGLTQESLTQMIQAMDPDADPPDPLQLQMENSMKRLSVPIETRRGLVPLIDFGRENGFLHVQPGIAYLPEEGSLLGSFAQEFRFTTRFGANEASLLRGETRNWEQLIDKGVMRCELFVRVKGSFGCFVQQVDYGNGPEFAFFVGSGGSGN